MHFKKQDLAGTHYTWNNGRHTFSGEPTRRRFDKNNGDQVLFLINFYASLAGPVSLYEGRIIEQTITRDLPDMAKSEVSAFNWIRRSVFTTR
ncbi:hypothetical protein LQ567_16280 [Niabella pedocola]|uniref:Uncharacterized protein n=1 Tax=Niabella pedocola TaxID=1752077 RepID=A0ABS8PTE5_9BACT|nr:hypothetical protein [Niabella pedocola]MCD2424338.1 hypothetical protein [Niabella pedocola]